MPSTIPVYLEVGQRWTFAAALDWPGWARKGRGEEDALAVLDSYRGRYRQAVGRRLPAGPLEVVGRVSGGGGTDFGVPAQTGPWDETPVDAAGRKRALAVLEASWAYLDEVAATAPEILKKGPRGGGRDRDAVVDHVREAERAYGPKLGMRIPGGLEWGEQRRLILERLADYDGARWPFPYAVRRLAWHILDHAWEIEDKSGGA